MKNYFENRGMMQRIVFDTQSKQFVAEPVPHPFTEQCDLHTQRLLDDIGLDTDCAAIGVLQTMDKAA